MAASFMHIWTVISQAEQELQTCIPFIKILIICLCQFLKPGLAYIFLWSDSLSVHFRHCNLFSPKPSPDTVLTHCKLNQHQEQVSVKLYKSLCQEYAYTAKAENASFGTFLVIMYPALFLCIERCLTPLVTRSHFNKLKFVMNNFIPHFVIYVITYPRQDYIAKDTSGLDSDRWIPLRGSTRIPRGL